MKYTELWCLWPDSTMCELFDLYEYLTWKSDDYQIVEVLAYDDYMEPIKWRPAQNKDL